MWERLERRLPGLSGSIVARVRYFDDFTQAAVADGIEQLVILGAGYDTRACRIEELRKIRVFEVDHPGTQPLKTEKIRHIFGSLPGHITYVPVDFETEKPGEKLAGQGYDSSKKTLFVLEGVSMYIPPEAVDETLSFIAHNSGKGSTVIFDYGHPPVNDGTGVRKFQKHVEQYEEPVKFGIEPGMVERFLLERGFSMVRNVSAEDYKRLYFHGKNEGRRVSSLAFVHATID